MKKLFPSGSQTVNSDPFPDGSLIVFDHNAAIQLGVVLGFKKGKYVILTHKEREVELTANRMYKLDSKIKSIARADKVKELKDLYISAEKHLPEINLADVWEMAIDSGFQTPSMVHELLFSDSAVEKRLSIWIALCSDKVYFKRDHDKFTARPKSVVDELMKAQAVFLSKQIAEQELVAFIRHNINENNNTLPESSLVNEDGIALLELLKDLAADAQLQDRAKEARDLLERILTILELQFDGPVRNKAFSLLNCAKIFNPDENLAIIRHRPHLRFSQKVLAESESLNIVEVNAANLKGNPVNKRRDLTHLMAFTIDDMSTKDMDDAITIERTTDGFDLGIHISDVACAVTPNTLTFQEAKRRGTSIYCPDQVISMLPETLCNDRLSLVEHQNRPTVSCLFKLNRDYEIISSEVCLSVIQVKQRYHYDQVDLLLDIDSPDLNYCYSIMASLEANRLELGAVKMTRKDVNVVLTENGGFELVEIDENSPSRLMVGEFMVLANATFAKFAADNKIPLVFRGQEGPDEAEGNSEDRRIRLKPSTIGVNPKPHYALGLKAYAQLTSPIRRFMDLVNQLQIENFLLGEPLFFTPQDLKDFITDIEPALALAKDVSQESKRYWLYKYLEGEARAGNNISGAVTRTDLKRPLAELERIHINVFFDPKGQKKPGDQVFLKITSVNAHDDILKLVEI